MFQQTDGKYSIWDNEIDWFAYEQSTGSCHNLSHEEAVEALKLLNDKGAWFFGFL